MPVADGEVRVVTRRLRLAPSDDGHAAIVLAVVPWLGVPVLASAALAAAGHRLPGEVLPVVAFLPLAVGAYVAAVNLPERWPPWALGLPGLALAIGLLAFLWRGPEPGVARTLWVALAAAVASTLAVGAGAWALRLQPLATAAGLAMVACQGLDGWLTYLAVGNPFGWLEHAATERVLVSRLLLEAAPALYPALKLALATGIAVALGRGGLPGSTHVPAVLVVCYAGLSPAVFSAANLLAG